MQNQTQQALGNINIPNDKPTQSPELDAMTPPFMKALTALDKLSTVKKIELYLPILKTDVVVEPYIGAEDLDLKSMQTSGVEYVDAFNKLLFRKCTFKDIAFKNYEDFIKNVTPVDKTLLVYGLLAATFSKLPEKTIGCPKCNKQEVYDMFSPSDMYHPEDIIEKEWTYSSVDDFLIQSKILDGFDIEYKMPTESDKLQILSFKDNASLRNTLKEENDVFTPMEMIALYINKMTIKDGDSEIVLTDKIKDILPTLKKMPLDLKTGILEDGSIELFSDYMPNFYLKCKCQNPECGHDFIWAEVNPEQDFFRKAIFVYQ